MAHKDLVWTLLGCLLTHNNNNNNNNNKKHVPHVYKEEKNYYRMLFWMDADYRNTTILVKTKKTTS